jgi:dihydroxyacid dehydratase/phosphogluconate dehydratase
VTSANVARLGVTAARVVVEGRGPQALDGVTDSDHQTEALRDLIDKVPNVADRRNSGRSWSRILPRLNANC